MSAQIAAVFERAAARIERDGWHRGAYYPGWETEGVHSGATVVGEKIRNESLPCCALGAVYAEAGNLVGPAVTNLTVHLGFEDDSEIPEWNDKPSQRKARVVAALRRAAQKEAQSE